MPRRKTQVPRGTWTEREHQAQEAAYLFGQFKMSQEQISEALGCSQPHVSRLLALAEQKRWLVTSFEPWDIPGARLMEIQRRLEPTGLAEALQRVKSRTGVCVRNVRVVGGAATKTAGPLSIDQRLRTFGDSAAGRLNELLHENMICGVTFGGTIHAAVEGLDRLRPKLRSEGPIQFVPVSGELATHAGTEASSSWLADRLREILNGGLGPKYSLMGVRAFIPRGVKGRKAILDYVCGTDSYKRIFEGPDALVGTLDALLTSVGLDHAPLGRANEELVKAAGMSNDRLRSLVQGDIGAVLVPKWDRRLDEKQRKDLVELAQMFTGLTLDHLESLARRAAVNGQPGVIVLAIGRSKATCLSHMIQYGLVNELIIDSELAGALKCEDYSD